MRAKGPETHTEAAFDLDRIGGPKGFANLVDLVVSMGEQARLAFGQGATVTKKPDKSPVTEADHAVEEAIRAFLDKHHPDAAFFGEESGERSGARESELRFIVDPIDGTRAFLRGIPTWSVLLALEFRGEPVLGIAYMPSDRDLFVGAKGHGVTINGRPAHLSQVEKLADSVVSHGGIAQFTDEGRESLLLDLGRQTYTQRGFADFDGYRQLLLGRVDAMVDPGIKAYDIAVPAVLVREAGGRLTDLAGQDSIFGGGAIASNGKIHDELLALCRG